MTVIDTDILIDVLRGHPPAVSWIAGVRTQLVVPGFVAMELMSGAFNAVEQNRVERLLRGMTIVWPSAAACDWALREFQRLHLNNGLGILDALITTTAIELKQPIHSFNRKHFSVVTGLVVVTPYTR